MRRLQSYGKLEGLVVGPWGEVSKDLHSLVKTLADCKVAAKARALGRDISDKELGIVVTQIRKYLSTSFIRAQGLCLINRLSYLGEGALQLQAEDSLLPVLRKVGEETAKLTIWLLYEAEASPEKARYLCLKYENILL